MHFWIDKRSQGCGHNGRYRVPPSLSGPRRNQRLLCGGVHPKLMVTPVHRFQSIESVATGGLRHPRAPSYHTRFPLHVHPQCTPILRNNVAGVNNSMQGLANEQSQNQTVTTGRANTPTAKLKCGVWAFFAILTFFIAGAKYYFHGSNMGIEALAFCSLLVIVLIIGGLVSLYEALSKVPAATQTTPTRNPPSQNPSTSEQQQELTEEIPNQVPNSIAPVASQTEMPPPPYHIAIMLPTHAENEPLTIIRDSPPPSYDKAVT